METVFIRNAAYHTGTLPAVIRRLIDDAGGLPVSPGVRVLVKPNLLSFARPEKAVTTHPLVVRCVCERLLEAGAEVTVADSQAVGGFDRILRVGGYQKALAGLPLTIRPFTDTVKADIGGPFGEIELAKDALAHDLIVNLAKLKTHTQMRMTLGVKNLFGCVVGVTKSQWHLRCGFDRDRFAELLVRIHDRIGPALTLIDGVLAMEGQGPGPSGTPRHLGVMIAGKNAHAADLAVAQMVGARVDEVPPLAAAARLGRLPAGLDIQGDFFTVLDFRLPPLGPLAHGPPAVQRLMRLHLLPRPALATQNPCRHCGECWNICPAGAVAPVDESPVFDYDKCIRCYCCVEVCPHAALAAVETLPGKVFRRGARAFRDLQAAVRGR
jgi:uncharacterized protein (DUF362 family)/Pyruvate/2-oxoacid:ferredoxin oxidoreductase delta subunit